MTRSQKKHLALTLWLLLLLALLAITDKDVDEAPIHTTADDCAATYARCYL